MTTYDAVVLAGGRSRRMSVEDKTRLVVGGVPLLDRVLAACTGAATRIVVGDPRPTAADVTWTRESPVGGGPAAAVVAALPLVTAPVVVLLAGDLPFVDAATVELLAARVVADAVDGAVLVDSAGQEQWLCSAWQRSALRGAGLRADGSLRAGLGALRLARVSAAESGTAPWLDCDTPDDVRAAEEMLP